MRDSSALGTEGELRGWGVWVGAARGNGRGVVLGVCVECSGCSLCSKDWLKRRVQTAERANGKHEFRLVAVSEHMS